VTKKQPTDLRSVLKRFIARKKVEEKAKELGVVERERDVDIWKLVLSTILGFTVGKKRTLASLRREYEKACGKSIVASAFYDRFTPVMAKLFKSILGDLMTGMTAAETELSGVLRSFRDVLLVDSTLIRLHDLLAKAFPASRTNHTLAALKAHVILSVRSQGPKSIKVTSGKTHDGPVLRAGKWVRDRLLLFDLGYYRFQLFACIDREGGYFVSRLKDKANPLISAVFQNLRGRKVPLEGRHLQDVLSQLKRRVIDIEVELVFKKQTYAGKKSKGRFRCRLVGVWNDEAKRYHLYLTNIMHDRMTAEDIARTYSARWLVELAFRSLKQEFRIDQMPSTKRHIVETLLYAAFIAMLLSQSLLAFLRTRIRRDKRNRLAEERWAAVFASVADELLAIIVRRSSEKQVKLLQRFLLHEMVDPNLSRARLLERASRGSHAA
jgi:IS4 transposase